MSEFTETFGDNVVFAYTDTQAIDDGVLVDISSLGATLNGRPVNRVTAAAFWGLVPTCFPREEGESDDDLALRLLREVSLPVAIERAKDEDGDGRIYAATLNVPTPRGVWFVENEVGGYTFMLPEDY